MSTDKSFKHKFYESNEHAAEHALTVDTQGRTAYFACASYVTSDNRRGDNVAKVRSFWLDIDCGIDKPYKTASEGLIALAAFRKTVGLPVPVVVSSGNGLHVYWPVTEDIDPIDWLPTALTLKRATEIGGLAADPKRTADIASILRPVGTHHRKGEPREVRLLRPGQPLALIEFAQLLDDYLSSHNVLPERAARASSVASNDDLSGGTRREFAPGDANRIADNCAVMGEVRATKGLVPEPTWYAALSVIGRCVDGEALAHEWSTGDSRYTYDETAAKLARAMELSGPMSCQQFGQFEKCSACPHYGKIHGPAALGYDASAVVVAPVSPAAPGMPALPDGYRVPKVQLELQFSIPDKNGRLIWVTFCKTPFWPINRIRQDNVYATEIEMLSRNGARKTFTIPSSTVGAGGKELSSLLAGQEIVATSGNKPRLEAYLSSWMDKLKNDVDEIATFTHYGWHDNDFLIGNELITPSGTKQALTRDNAKRKEPAFTISGDYAIWKEVIDVAYNRAGQEAMQYMVLLGFAAPLFALFRQYGGVTVYAHSEGSGVGKTTAQRAAISAWGDWNQLQLADGKTTQNALWATIGTYCNIPVLFDELTNQANSVASDVVFSVSSGRDKERLGKDAKLKEVTNTWSTIMMASGNVLLTEKLSTHRANAEAEIARTFEFTVNSVPHLSPNEANILFPKLQRNYGHASRTFMEYVVANREKIETALNATQSAFNVEHNIAQSERYWSALQASVLVALKLCHKLDILHFDITAIKHWIGRQLICNRTQLNDSVVLPLEQFGRMLNDLSRGILVTYGEGDLRAGDIAEVVPGGNPQGEIIGRVIMPRRAINGAAVLDRPALMISIKAVKDWCNKNKSSAREMYEAVYAAGWVQAKTDNYSLGKGTVEYTSRSASVKCWFIDPQRVAAAVPNLPIARKVQLVPAVTHTPTGTP